MEESKVRLGESEYRFACIVWEGEPLTSGELVKRSAQQLGWKKSTSYTVLKNLIAKGVLQNENSVVTSRLKKAEIQRTESAAVVEKTFGGSLPRFVAAFLDGHSLSADDAAEIQAMIDRYREVR